MLVLMSSRAAEGGRPSQGKPSQRGGEGTQLMVPSEASPTAPCLPYSTVYRVVLVFSRQHIHVCPKHSKSKWSHIEGEEEECHSCSMPCQHQNILLFLFGSSPKQKRDYRCIVGGCNCCLNVTCLCFQKNTAIQLLFLRTKLHI